MNSRLMELEGSGITPSMHRMGKQAKWGLQDSMCASTLLILPFSQRNKQGQEQSVQKGRWLARGGLMAASEFLQHSFFAFTFIENKVLMS